MTQLALVLLLSATIHSNAQTITNYTTSDGLPSDNVLCLTRNGYNMWFGTQNGVAKFDGSSWTVYNTTTHTEIPNNTITAIASGTDGRIWIGTDYGAAVFDGSSWTKCTTSEGLGSNRINNIFASSNGDIWFSDFKGATKFDGTDFTTYGTTEGLPFGGVEDIDEAQNGDIVFATGLGGVYVYDGTDFTAYTEANGLVSNSTTAIEINADGELWVGTSDGVSVFDKSYNLLTNHTRMYSLPPPDTLNPVEDLVIDSRGNVWVGIYVDYLVSVGGVAMFGGSTWVDYDDSKGIAGPTIRKLSLDSDNNVWVGTSTGVSKIESPYLASPSIHVERPKIYPNPANGVLNISLNHSTGAEDGLRICTINGRVVFEEELIPGKEQSVDISNLNPGIYVLRIGAYSEKLIVQ